MCCSGSRFMCPAVRLSYCVCCSFSSCGLPGSAVGGASPGTGGIPVQSWKNPQRTTRLIWAIRGCCCHMLGLDLHVRLLLPGPWLAGKCLLHTAPHALQALTYSHIKPVVCMMFPCSSMKSCWCTGGACGPPSVYPCHCHISWLVWDVSRSLHPPACSWELWATLKPQLAYRKW